MFNERFLFLPLGSTTVLSWLIRGLKMFDVSRRNEPSYAGLRETDTPALEVLPPNLSIESGGAAGNSISSRPLLVPVVTSKEPPMPFSEIKLILDLMALKEIKLTIEFVDRLQNTYALLVLTTTLGSEASMLESPISACTRPLEVANTNNDEVL